MSKNIISNNSIIVNQQPLSTNYDPTCNDYSSPLDANDYTPLVKVGGLFKADTYVDYTYTWELNGIRVIAGSQHTTSNNTELLKDFLNCSKQFQSELRNWVNTYSLPVAFTYDTRITGLKCFLADFNNKWNFFINNWACKHNFITYNDFSKWLIQAVEQFYNTIFQEHGVGILKSLETADSEYEH